MSEFKVGNEVIWISQSGGNAKTKVGRVVAVVGADCATERCVPYGLILKNPGASRKYRSYLVQVGTSKRLYWPNVKHLQHSPQLIDKYCSCGNKKQRDGACDSCRPPILLQRNRQYAEVCWTAEDVKTLRTEWPISNCELELRMIEKQLRDAIIEHGWELLAELLPLHPESKLL